MTIDFKGAHYPNSVILYAVYSYVRFGVSYRDLEQLMAERGVAVDHATLNPSADGFVADPNTVCGAQILDITQAHRKTVISQDGVCNNLRWKTVA